MNEWTQWRKAPLDPGVAALVKPKTRGHTVFRGEAVVLARQRAAGTTWGKAVATRILEVADYWAAKSDRELLDLVPTGNPGAITPHQYHGDPISGGNKNALVTCLETPYRWLNPATGQWWYDGVTVTNPATGEPVVVRDDGSGFVAPAGFPHPGERTLFVGAYRSFLIGMLTAYPFYGTRAPEVQSWPIASPEEAPDSSGGRYAYALPRLAEAYALTGKRVYAKKAAILIGRLAELYPYMNGMRVDGSPQFVCQGMHWGEQTTTESWWLIGFFDAVDLVWDAVDAPMDDELGALFATAPAADGGKRQTRFALKPAVNEMLFYAVQAMETARNTTADWRLRWSETGLALAACSDSPALLSRILFEDAHCLRTTLVNNFHRDGRYHYDSAGYMQHQSRTMLALPIRSIGFTGEPGFVEPFNLCTDPRLVVSPMIRLAYTVANGSEPPSFGDVPAGRNPRPVSEERLAGMPYYHPVMELAPAYLPEARELFKERFRGQTAADIEALRTAKGDFYTLAYALPAAELAGAARGGALPCALLEDSQIAYLRCGQTFRTRHDLVLWGQLSAGHVHGDKLGLWFGGRGRHLAASSGGYPFVWGHAKELAWERHSAACWVVLIDGQSQNLSESRLLAHHEGEMFRLSALANDSAYPGSHYERQAMLVPGPTDGDAYVLDLFRVAGGKVFDYNTLGTDAGTFADVAFAFDSPPPAWTSRPGSLAGEDVALYSAPGYGWMKDVRESAPAGDCSWTFDYSGAGLKVHALAGGRSRKLLFAMGEMGGLDPGKSPWNPHVLWRDEAADAASHRTQFVTVLESMGAKPFLARVRSLTSLDGERSDNNEPVGVEIRHADGHRDIIIAGGSHGRVAGFRDAAGGVWRSDARAAMQRRDPAGGVVATEIFDGTLFETPDGRHEGPPALSGRIEAVDYAVRRIVVRLETAPRGTGVPLDGRVGIMAPASGGRPSPYRLHDAKVEGDRLTFTAGLSLIHAETAWPTAKTEMLSHYPYGPMPVTPIRTRPRVTLDGREVVVDVVPGDGFRLPLATVTYARQTNHE